MAAQAKQEASDDASMADVPMQQQQQPQAAAVADEEAEAAGGEEDEEAEQAELDLQSVRILPGSTDKAASFEFLNEGHTLGNALRYIVMKNPDVEMCAYTIPHPSEAKMHVRIQTHEKPAVDALQKGLRDIQDLCDVVAEEFCERNREFAAAARGDAMEV
jgi:DNA-directed RNA polymerase I and III subunit RPAC2